METIKNNENPLYSLCFNILIPVMILRNGNKWVDRILIYFQGSDPVYKNENIYNSSPIVFFIALLFPVIYFLYDYLNRKNKNLISVLGFVNILLTGGIGIFGAKFALSKNWFILKEALLPFLIGLVFMIMSKYRQSSFNKILLNDALFDNHKISISIKDEMQKDFEKIVKKAGYYFTSGFFISCIIQFILASLIVVSNPGEPSFNEEVSTMTCVSYLAVLIPTILIVGKGYWGLILGIEKITGLKKEEFLRS